MKHLIQHSASGKYFSHGNWTSDISRAQEFANPLSLITFSIQEKLKDAELVLVLGNSPSPNDIRIRIFDR